MDHIIIPQSWTDDSRTFYGQVKRISAGHWGVKVFECQHHHRAPNEAATCPDVIAARDADKAAVAASSERGKA